MIKLGGRALGDLGAGIVRGRRGGAGVGEELWHLESRGECLGGIFRRKGQEQNLGPAHGALERWRGWQPRWGRWGSSGGDGQGGDPTWVEARCDPGAWIRKGTFKVLWNKKDWEDRGAQGCPCQPGIQLGLIERQ